MLNLGGLTVLQKEVGAIRRAMMSYSARCVDYD